MGACNGKSDPPVTSEPAEPPKSVTPEIINEDQLEIPNEDDIEGVCSQDLEVTKNIWSASTCWIANLLNVEVLFLFILGFIY